MERGLRPEEGRWMTGWIDSVKYKTVHGERRAKSDLRKLDEDGIEVCWGVLIANCFEVCCVLFPLLSASLLVQF